MSEKFIRVEMWFGFGCKCATTVARYEGEVLEGDRTYRDDRRNRASEIGIGEAWVSYSDGGDVPSYRACVIMRDTGDYGEVARKMVSMHDGVKSIMDVSAKQFADRVAAMSVTEAETAAMVEEAIRETAGNGAVREHISSVAAAIVSEAFKDGCLLCKDGTVGQDKWKEFFDASLADGALIAGVVRESPVVKCSGDYAEFSGKAARDEIVGKLALKVASDAFTRLKGEGAAE